MSKAKSAGKTKLSRGDLVQLRSGGPAMTVRDATNVEATCRWFSGETLRGKKFFREELRITSLPHEDRTLEIKRTIVGRDDLKDLARRVLFMAERAKRDGAQLPQEIVELLEAAESSASEKRPE